MRNLSSSGNASKFEVALFSPSIRTAMRLGGVFLGSGRVVGFRLSAEANLAVYRECAVAILADTKLSITYAVCNVHVNRRGETDTDDALRVLRSKDGVLVLIPHGAELPIEFLLNFDAVVDVGHVKPRHVASALKEVLGLNVSFKEADELAAYPLRVWVPAMRPGRTLKYVLSKLREVNNRPAPRTWTPKIEDLAGYGEAADWVLELAKDLNDWRAGRIAWRELDTGLLLSGPPGTGKTIFSQAAARTCELNVVLASSAQWQAKGHLGDMLAAMRKSFADALAKAPSILFIDEIDAIGDRRSFTGYNANYSSQVVNALLELIDGAEEREGVILIGATNYPEKIDPALLRAGRLGRHVSIPLPDKEARSRILSFHLEGVLQPGQLADAAMVTTGYSGADLEQVAKSAKRVARREGRGLVVDDVMSHLPPKVSLTEAERYSACIHEAGHAVVGHYLKLGTIETVTVAMQAGSRDQELGHVALRKVVPRRRSRQSYLDELAMILGGMAAERVFFGDVFDGSGGAPGSDLHRASDLATHMLVSLGMGKLCYRAVYNTEQLEELRRTDHELRQQVDELLSSQLARAEEIIRSQRYQVIAIVDALDTTQVLDGAVVSKLLT